MEDKKKSLLSQIEKIFDKHWVKHFRKPIFGVDVFLNPNVLYPLQASEDEWVYLILLVLCREKHALHVDYKMNFHKCMLRMVLSNEKRLEIMQQIIKYKEKLGYFSMPLADDSSLMMDPGKILSIQSFINHHLNHANVMIFEWLQLDGGVVLVWLNVNVWSWYKEGLKPLCV